MRTSPTRLSSLGSFRRSEAQHQKQYLMHDRMPDLIGRLEYVPADARAYEPILINFDNDTTAHERSC